MSPTMENFIVLTWLRSIDQKLPRLIKQRYGTELRSCALTSIKPEISQALTSLVDEVHTAGDARTMRAAASNIRRFPRQRRTRSGQSELTSISGMRVNIYLIRTAGI